MRRWTSAVAVAAGVLMSASVASAQDTGGATQRPFDFGLLGGLSMPMGDFADVAGIGFHIGGFGETRLSTTSPIRIRAEIAYNRFGAKGVEDVGEIEIDGSYSVLSFTGNAIYDLPTEGMVRPYVMGGLGLYRFSSDIDADIPGVGDVDGGGSSTEFGFNIGGGVAFQLSGFSTFAEIRYHTADFSYIPVSFGIRF